MGRRMAAVAGLVGCMTLAVPAAEAAEVHVSTQRYRTPFNSTETVKRVVVTGGRERNHVVVTSDGGIVVSDRAGITPGAGCQRRAGAVPTAVCAVFVEDPGDLEPPPPIRAVLGAGDDIIRFRDTEPADEFGGEIDGGPGDDELLGGLADNVLRGGPGRDELIARGNSTMFDEGRGANGSDTFRFGYSDGTLSYAGRSRAVRVDMRAPGNAGQAGERDRVLAGRAQYFRVVGGRGDDRLVGRNRRDVLLGGPGADAVAGRGGDDTLMADGPGGFDLVPGRRRDGDRLNGGAGSDGLYGNRGRNRLDGGRGSDDIKAGGGADVIGARDRSPDSVDCGSGRDRAVLDVRDDIGARKSVRCEVPVRDRPAVATVAGGVEVDSGEKALVDQDGGFINLRCPADAPRRCRGRVDLVRGRRVMARGRFSIGRRGAAVRLRLTRLGRRTIRRSPDDDVPVSARVISRDRGGVRRAVTVPGFVMVYVDPNQFEGPGND